MNWLLLHIYGSIGDSRISVNMDHVVLVGEAGGMAKLLFPDGSSRYVSESPDEIFKALHITVHGTKEEENAS